MTEIRVARSRSLAESVHLHDVHVLFSGPSVTLSSEFVRRPVELRAPKRNTKEVYARNKRPMCLYYVQIFPHTRRSRGPRDRSRHRRLAVRRRGPECVARPGVHHAISPGSRASEGESEKRPADRGNALTQGDEFTACRRRRSSLCRTRDDTHGCAARARRVTGISWRSSTCT